MYENSEGGVLVGVAFLYPVCELLPRVFFLQSLTVDENYQRYVCVCMYLFIIVIVIMKNDIDCIV